MVFVMGITLNAVAQTASGSYLNVANYSTIDDAGWSNYYLDNLYLYNEYEDEGVAWLTLAVSGAYFNSADWTNHTGRGQKWITLNPNPEIDPHSNAYGSTLTYYAWTNNRTATSPMCGSKSYFGDKQVYVYGINSSTEVQSISFYVTNVDQVKVLKNFVSSTSGNYPSIITVSEYVMNAQGTLSFSVEVDKKTYTASSGGSYTSPNLDVSKIYRIECSTYKGNYREIAFRTPLNPAVITAEPNSLAFATTVGTPVTKTVNVKGVNLKEGITATITNNNGTVFTIDNTNISMDAASSEDGVDVTITFDPEEEGTFTGTLTLSTASAQNVTIPLTGEATTQVFELDISTAGLSTLYLDYDVSIPYEAYEPDLLGVYYIYDTKETTDENDKTVTELRSARLANSIPAKTGVIVHGNSGKYLFPRISEADPLPSARPNSLLRGCIDPTDVSVIKTEHPGAKIYTLGRGKDSFINFYEYSGTTLNANKAFFLLEAANGAKELSIIFDDEATGIRTATTLVEEGTWYTLQGIRLQGQPVTKGLYIHNGKTVVVK